MNFHRFGDRFPLKNPLWTGDFESNDRVTLAISLDGE
jgi:hypothetical protein